MLSFVTTRIRIPKLIIESQRRALISFFNDFASYVERENIFHHWTKIDLEPPYSETQFFEQCGHLKLRIETNFSREEVHYICIDIINWMERSTDCLTRLFDVLASAQKGPTSAEISSGSQTSSYNEERILVRNTEKAFTWRYNGEHAQRAFFEYLDIQWLKMIEEWDNTQGTLQSRCGTIIQSSCAGKSRLVDRYLSDIPTN